MAFHSVPADGADDSPVNVPRAYAWVVFALSFGLLLSDYMSRQVLNAVFPLLKVEWALSDTQLGSLSGVVALMVGLLTIPLSLLAERWGRIRSLTLMAMLWSLATLACGLSQGYSQMFASRFFVGIGEAAYGSVGVAVVLSVFPASMRATLTSAFMAGGMFGSVLGIALGGAIATHWSWRYSFVGMAIFGLLLSVIYPLIVRESRIGPRQGARSSASSADSPTLSRQRQRKPLASLVSCPSVLAAYVGSGLQLFVAAALMAWIPSFMNRYYDMPTDRSSLVAAIFVLLCGTGMVVCGMLSDRVCRAVPSRKIMLAMGCALISCLSLLIGFRLSPGSTQLLVIGLGMFFAAGTCGPSGAMLANLTHRSIHGTAFATMTFTNNLLGLAPGPLVVGLLADRFGLVGSLQLIPLASLVAMAAFFVAWLHYASDLRRIALRFEPATSQ